MGDFNQIIRSVSWDCMMRPHALVCNVDLTNMWVYQQTFIFTAWRVSGCTYIVILNLDSFVTLSSHLRLTHQYSKDKVTICVCLCVTDGKDLYIGKAVQKAYLEVTEEGSEGAVGSGRLLPGH